MWLILALFTHHYLSEDRNFVSIRSRWLLKAVFSIRHNITWIQERKVKLLKYCYRQTSYCTKVSSANKVNFCTFFFFFYYFFRFLDSYLEKENKRKGRRREGKGRKRHCMIWAINCFLFSEKKFISILAELQFSSWEPHQYLSKKTV